MLLVTRLNQLRQIELLEQKDSEKEKTVNKIQLIYFIIELNQ